MQVNPCDSVALGGGVPPSCWHGAGWGAVVPILPRPTIHYPHNVGGEDVFMRQLSGYDAGLTLDASSQRRNNPTILPTWRTPSVRVYATHHAMRSTHLRRCVYTIPFMGLYTPQVALTDNPKRKE